NGTNGTNGADGRTILSGTAQPGQALGNVGDFYLRTTTSALYGPKTGFGWGSPVSLIGPEGPAGSGTTSSFTLAFQSTDGQHYNKGTWIMTLPAKQVELGTAGALVQLSVTARTFEAGSLTTFWNVCYNDAGPGNVGVPVKDDQGNAIAIAAALGSQEPRSVSLNAGVTPVRAGLYWVGPCFDAADDIVVHGGLGYGILLQ
ncbi:MAG: hypothetical protein KC635_25700, partial [Myxococcales bacterium]|nr:hypothetical protein [Myxococcales bacterium]